MEVNPLAYSNTIYFPDFTFYKTKCKIRKIYGIEFLPFIKQNYCFFTK